MKNLVILPIIFLAIGLLPACTKNDTLQTAQIEEFMPLQPGKYIRYRLDSMLFIDFGQRDTTISYDAKDVVDAEITDNAGRRSFRIIRYLRSLTSTDEADYTPALTLMVTPSRESIEVQENNLKFQKLKLPVTEGFSWRGNAFIPALPFYEIYEFSNDEDMDLWDYTYHDVNQSVTLNDVVYDSTITVVQVSDSSNVPIEFPDALGYRNHWVEVYAKNLGLIYKEAVMWEYQPPNAGNPGFRSGFGIKMTIIDHN
jgi:hypothetical protein